MDALWFTEACGEVKDGQAPEYRVFIKPSKYIFSCKFTIMEYYFYNKEKKNLKENWLNSRCLNAEFLEVLESSLQSRVEQGRQQHLLRFLY